MRDPGSASELPVLLDRAAEESLPTQLAATLRMAIDNGTLRPGEYMQATRGFAERLGIARGVVVSAYEQLIAEGYLDAGHGRGTVVSPQLFPPKQPNGNVARPNGGRPRTTLNDWARGMHAAPPLPLMPGIPDTSNLDRPPWRSAWRTALAQAHVEAPALGNPRLRAEIAEHLRRMRGTNRMAEDVIITAGAREGLSLVLAALRRVDNRPLVIGVEDPGYPSLRRVALRSGAEIVPLPVDSYGPTPTSLVPGSLDAIIVTPSHQYPLGGSMPLARRQELLAWAKQTGAVIIEDDYDSELRYVGSPLPALAALDDPMEGTIVLLGTFSTTIARGLSAGYLLAPERLRRAIEPARFDMGGTVSGVVQAALTEYLASGELRRHTARMRRRYARARGLVVTELGGLPNVRVRPMSGGLNAVLDFGSTPSSADLESRIVEAVTQAGLGGVALNHYWKNHEGTQHGLVIGIGAALAVGSNAIGFEVAIAELRRLLLAELGN